MKCMNVNIPGYCFINIYLYIYIYIYIQYVIDFHLCLLPFQCLIVEHINYIESHEQNVFVFVYI